MIQWIKDCVKNFSNQKYRIDTNSCFSSAGIRTWKAGDYEPECQPHVVAC